MEYVSLKMLPKKKAILEYAENINLQRAKSDEEN